MSLLAIEIGALYNSTMNTQKDLCNIIALSKSDCRHVFDKSGKVAISTSLSIFMARRKSVWNLNQPVDVGHVDGVLPLPSHHLTLNIGTLLP